MIETSGLCSLGCPRCKQGVAGRQDSDNPICPYKREIVWKEKLDKFTVSRDCQVPVRCGELHAKIGP